MNCLYFDCLSLCLLIKIILFVLLILAIFAVISRLTVGICKSPVNLAGKTVIITGGNSGLGFQVALALAGRGAKVIIADVADGQESVKTIIEATNNKTVSYKYLNLASFTSIRKFAKEINEEESRLDILLNNAGIAGNSKLTEDGFQYVIQVNHLGPFLLTHLLIDLLKKSSPSRIIFTASVASYFHCLTLDNIDKVPTLRTKPTQDLYAYANTKCLTIITANLFAKKLSDTGVTSNSLHPGIINTNIFKSYLRKLRSIFFMRFIFDKFLAAIGKTTWEGMQTHLDCAISKKWEKTTGKFFMDCTIFPPPRKVLDEEFCIKAWEKCEELAKLTKKEKL